MTDPTQELEIDYAAKKLKLRGSEIIQTVVAIVVVAMMVLFGYVLHEHKKEDAKQNDRYIAAIDKMTEATLRNGITQREMLCILSLEQSERAKELSGVSSLCKRLSAAP